MTKLYELKHLFRIVDSERIQTHLFEYDGKGKCFLVFDTRQRLQKKSSFIGKIYKKFILLPDDYFMTECNGHGRAEQITGDEMKSVNPNEIFIGVPEEGAF